MSLPFIKLFKTINGHYVYDVNKDNILSINKDSYKILENILESGNEESVNYNSELKELVKKGYLSNKRVKEFRHIEYDKIDKILSNGISQIALQVTQGCNLRCSYCAYANTDNNLQRNYSKKNMSFNTAKSAVDFLLEHSSAVPEVYIAFYGGEPLLEYDLIKSVIKYAKDVFAGKKISFSMTTNATLLTYDIWDFLTKNDTSIVLSIDGPKEIHDLNRLDASGKGSFDKVLENVENIFHKCKNIDFIKKHLRINMVVDPKNDFDLIDSLYKNKFLKQLNARYTIADDLFLNKKFKISENYLTKYRYNMFLTYLSYFNVIDGINRSHMLKNHIDILSQKFESLRKINSMLPDKIGHAGPCVPGKKRLFIDVDGKFFPCERVSESSDIMNIGSLKDGFYIDKIKNLLDVTKLTEDECKDCWAFSHCNICVRTADDGGKLSKDAVIKVCPQVLSDTYTNMLEYIFIKEYNRYYKN